MSKFKLTPSKVDPKTEGDVQDERPQEVEKAAEKPAPKDAEGYGKGGVYQSIGGGKRVKVS